MMESQSTHLSVRREIVSWPHHIYQPTGKPKCSISMTLTTQRPHHANLQSLMTLYTPTINSTVLILFSPSEEKCNIAQKVFTEVFSVLSVGVYGCDLLSWSVRHIKLVQWQYICVWVTCTWVCEEKMEEQYTEASEWTLKLILLWENWID